MAYTGTGVQITGAGTPASSSPSLGAWMNNPMMQQNYQDYFKNSVQGGSTAFGSGTLRKGIGDNATFNLANGQSYNINSGSDLNWLGSLDSTLADQFKTTYGTGAYAPAGTPQVAPVGVGTNSVAGVTPANTGMQTSDGVQQQLPPVPGTTPTATTPQGQPSWLQAAMNSGQDSYADPTTGHIYTAIRGAGGQSGGSIQNGEFVADPITGYRDSQGLNGGDRTALNGTSYNNLDANGQPTGTTGTWSGLTPDGWGDDLKNIAAAMAIVGTVGFGGSALVGSGGVGGVTGVGAGDAAGGYTALTPATGYTAEGLAGQGAYTGTNIAGGAATGSGVAGATVLPEVANAPNYALSNTSPVGNAGQGLQAPAGSGTSLVAPGASKLGVQAAVGAGTALAAGTGGPGIQATGNDLSNIGTTNYAGGNTSPVPEWITNPTIQNGGLTYDPKTGSFKPNTTGTPGDNGTSTTVPKVSVPNGTTGNTGNGIDALINGLTGLYGANAQSKTASDQRAWLDKQMGDIDKLYAPGSPEYNQLMQEMERKDAAAGRNSQYGPRSVDLAAKIAETKAKYKAQIAMGSSGAMMQALQSGNSSLDPLLAMLGQMQKNGGITNLSSIVSGLFN